MREWQEPHESLSPLIRFTAAGLLRGGGRRQRLAYFYHSLRRIVFRTRGVILVSTGKSGRTWLRFMLDELGIHIQYTHAGGKPERPRDLEGRLIHLHRDPRDTVASAWFQHRKRGGGYSGDFADFLRDPSLGLERRVRFNLFWAEQVAGCGGLVTSYERLQADTMAELGRIVMFITGTLPADAELARAAAAGSFARMQALEASGQGARLYGEALAPGDPGDPESYKIRQGGTGTWRAHFTAADAEYAERVLEEHGYFERMRQVSAEGQGARLAFRG